MATEIIPRTIEPTQALSVPEVPAGVMALAMMTDGEFEQQLVFLKRGQERIRKIKQELMAQDVHYGVIPGTDKPALLKPGSELLFQIYQLRPDFVATTEYGDGVVAPPVRVTMRCEVYLGSLGGPVVGVGYGSANSWERKHRYRVADRACPSCGELGTVRRSNYPNKSGAFQGQKGWWCKFCRTNWDNPEEPAIREQQTGMVENRDQHDLENTLLKMAKKRAQIDAALTATASSDLFTQDIEEEAPPPEPTKLAATPQQAEEPGIDPEDFPDHGYPEGVLPPTREAARAKKEKQNADGPACPGCGRPSGKCKWPGPGKTHFCNACGITFEPGVKK